MALAARIKEITANKHQSGHGKRKDAVTVTLFWRLSISVNNEAENLMILPPIDEHLEDKLIILKAEKHDMPMDTSTLEGWKLFWQTLVDELPCYLHYLFNAVIPAEYSSTRYGITHFHHPEVIQELDNLSPEMELLDLIRLSGIVAKKEGRGGAKDLEPILIRDDELKRRAEKLFSWRDACGTYLGRLARKMPGNIEKIRHSSGTEWVIRSV